MGVQSKIWIDRQETAISCLRLSRKKPCLSVITPISQGELILIPLDEHAVARDANRAQIIARQDDYEA